jgi:hypothetical protein
MCGGTRADPCRTANFFPLSFESKRMHGISLNVILLYFADMDLEIPSFGEARTCF